MIPDSHPPPPDAYKSSHDAVPGLRIWRCRITFERVQEDLTLKPKI